MMQKTDAHKIADGLKPCPFCGLKPAARILGAGNMAVNPSARCVTVDCMGSKLPSIPLDVPEYIAAWNTRSETCS